MIPETVTGNEETTITTAIREGDEAAFTAFVERHRHELRVHCYRMLASPHDAEDAVQETFLRAWRYRRSLDDGRPLRPWLYRIATNACLDAVARERRGAADPGEEGEVTWLRPVPDSFLEPVAPRDAEPDARLVRKETIELAFLAAIQLLTPQQRAALILRDVLGWSARETAELLDVTVAAANGALQRARARLRQRLPSRRPAGTAATDPTEEERALLRQYVQANDNADIGALESLIREDAVFRMPPEPGTTRGRAAMIRRWTDGGFGPEMAGRIRSLVTRANLQPAIAAYLLGRDGSVYRPLAMDVLSIEDGLIAEIVTFPNDVFPLFGLPAELPAE
jgi:RNA polymerase sigma-70 factor, ECF subfamily